MIAALLTAVIAIAPTAPSIASQPTDAIDRFCDGLIPMTKRNPGRLFGLLPKGYGKGHWVEFKRLPEMNAAIEAEQVFDIAQVWSRDDGATAVSMRFTSGSGDWVHFVEYCFRADGTLAHLHSTLNTFNAVDKDPEKEVSGAIRVRFRYFDASGKQIKLRKRVLDLETKRPAPTLQFMDDEEPIYKKAAALPFSFLLKPGRRTRGCDSARNLPYIGCIH
jgi:hypothetical protein